MLEIKNVDVYGLRSSVIASGYAMREDVIDYDEESERYTSHFFRAERLAKAGGGSGHSTYRTGIIVQFDIKYTGFFSPESQRYHWWQIVTSMSKMHRIGRLVRKNIQTGEPATTEVMRLIVKGNTHIVAKLS